MSRYRAKLKKHIIYENYYIDQKNVIVSDNELDFKFKTGGKPINLEIGCGTGHFIKKIAIQNKEQFYIGIEKKAKIIKKAINKVYNYNIENVFFLRGDIFFFIEFFDNNMFNNIYINFSDPWPKKRHIKRRVINQKFLDKIYLKLKNNGKLYFVTDDKNYLNYSIEQFKIFGRFKPCFENYYVNDIEGYPESLYCKMFKEKGLVINYTCYLKD